MATDACIQPHQLPRRRSTCSEGILLLTMVSHVNDIGLWNSKVPVLRIAVSEVSQSEEMVFYNEHVNVLVNCGNEVKIIIKTILYAVLSAFAL
jgi:hypothetical protein